MNLIKTLQEIWHRLLGYLRITRASEIARRYFAMNAFDGVLTIIGVLMGSLFAGVTSSKIVLTTGLSTSIAMGISGLWGAYLTESAERNRELAELGKQTLTDLNDTRIGKASRFAVVVIALVDGLSPFLAAILILLPFFAIDFFPSITTAYYTAIGLALLTLFCLGLFLGHISQENMIFYGVKTVAAGLLSIAVSFLLGGE